MSWLRLDPGFPGNAKIVQLTDREYRVWTRILCYCAQAQDPTVDRETAREIPGCYPRDLARFEALHLLDKVGAKHEVHDWVLYLPKDTPTERQARWRARKALAQQSETASTSASTPASTPASTSASLARASFDSYSSFGGSQVFDSKAEPLSDSARESLPSNLDLLKPINTRTYDPVNDLLDAIPDKDSGTETVLRAFRLPEFAYRQAQEQIQSGHGGVKLAVTILQRIEQELLQPNAEHTAQPLSPEQLIRKAIANGAVPDLETLEAEMRAVGLNGDTAVKLRALIAADTATRDAWLDTLDEPE